MTPYYASKDRRYVRCMLPMNCIAASITCKKWLKFFSDIPDDAELVSWYTDPHHDSISMVFYHSSFKVVDEGAEIPLGPMMQTALWKPNE